MVLCNREPQQQMRFKLWICVVVLSPFIYAVWNAQTAFLSGTTSLTWMTTSNWQVLLWYFKPGARHEMQNLNSFVFPSLGKLFFHPTCKSCLRIGTNVRQILNCLSVCWTLSPLEGRQAQGGPSHNRFDGQVFPLASQLSYFLLA